MASTRKTPRSSSQPEQTTGVGAKRKRSSSPSCSSPVDSVVVDVVEEEEEVEEELVTEDLPPPGDPPSLQDIPAGSADTATREPFGQADKTSSSVVFVFKDPNFVHSSKGSGASKRTRVWKNLKQIVAAERTLPWGADDVTYGSIDAPPSFKPAKKYSDISGLESKYTDPQTKMRYANPEEYRRVRLLPGDIVTGCLALRKANTLVP